MLKPEDFFQFGDFEHSQLFAGAEYVWEPLKRLKEYLQEIVRPEIRGEVAPTAVVQGEVFIGEGTVVEPGAFISGPTYIGRNCHIRQGAYIRGVCLIGDGATVGHCTEVKGAIFLPGAGAPHFNYVGDSILGRKCNMGAGSILSNFKLTGDQVVVQIDGAKYPTGLRKFGGVIGDGTQVGCNAVLNPGTLLGPGCLVYPCASVRGYHGAGSVVKLVQQRDIKQRRDG